MTTSPSSTKTTVPPLRITSLQALKIMSSIIFQPWAVPKSPLPVTATITKNVPVTRCCCKSFSKHRLSHSHGNSYQTKHPNHHPRNNNPVTNNREQHQPCPATPNNLPCRTIRLGNDCLLSDNALAAAQFAAQSVSQYSLDVSGTVTPVSSNQTILAAEGIQNFTGSVNSVQAPTSGGPSTSF